MSPKMKTAAIVVGAVLVVASLSVCCISIYAYNFFSGLGGHYAKKDGKVYWVRVSNHDLRKIETEVEGADTKSFRAFRFSKSQWARDDNHVYFEGRRLRDADPATFEIVDVANKTSRDANNEYDGSRKTRNDDEKFVSMGMYSKDINGVYWFDRKIPNVDIDSFALMEVPKTKYKNDRAWAQDKNSVYCDGRVLPNSDPNSFQLVGANYGKDKNRVYYCATCLESAKPDSFQVIYHDKKYVVGDDGTHYYQFGKSSLKSKDDAPKK